MQLEEAAKSESERGKINQLSLLVLRGANASNLSVALSVSLSLCLSFP